MSGRFTNTILFSFLLINFISAQPFWKTTNGPRGSINNMIGVTSGGRIIIDSDMVKQGISYSDDKGETWTTITSPFHESDFQRIAIDNSDNIFVGGQFSDAIYRSTDLGESWAPVFQRYQFVLKVSPDDNIWSSGTGLFFSSDIGETWDTLSNGAFYYDIVFANNKIIYLLKGEIYKSTNNGSDWAQLNFTGSVSKGFVTSKGTLICGGTYRHNSNVNFWRSADGGVSWDSMAVGNHYPTAFLEDKDGNVYVSINSSGVLKSTDDGISWSDFSEGIKNLRIFDLAIDKQNNLYAVSDVTGVYMLESGKAEWKNISPNFTTIPRLIVDENDNVIAVATSPNRIFNSSDYGESWNQPADAHEYSGEPLDITSDGTLFSIASKQILKSTDFGASWDAVFEDNESNYDFRNIFIDDRDDIYAIRGYKIIRSTDSGENWDPIGSPVPALPKVVNVNALSKIFVGTDEGLYYSDNSGIDWIKANEIFSGPITTIASHRSYVFAAVYGNKESKIVGLYFSSDNGETWTKQNNGLPDGYRPAIKFSNDGKIVYAISNGVFFWSDDYGKSWNELSDGIEDIQIVSMAIGKDDEILIGTKWRGVYKSSGPVTSVETETELPTDFTLEQNYPNPFGKSLSENSTVIEFSVPNVRDEKFSSLTTLKVYNILGKEIATLVNERKTPGNYSVRFDAKELPSGVYFYSLTLGGKTITKKMLLLK